MSGSSFAESMSLSLWRQSQGHTSPPLSRRCAN